MSKGHNQTRFINPSKQWVKTDENRRKSAFLTLLLKVNYYFVSKDISSLKNVSENMQNFLLLWIKGISRQNFLIPKNIYLKEAKNLRKVVLSPTGMGMISWCCPAWSSCVAFSFILQINKPLQSISQSEMAATLSCKLDQWFLLFLILFLIIFNSIFNYF